jgi:hypothetical protein
MQVRKGYLNQSAPHASETHFIWQKTLAEFAPEFLLTLKQGMLKICLEAFPAKQFTPRTYIILIIRFPILYPFFSLVCSEYSIRLESVYMNRRGG